MVAAHQSGRHQGGMNDPLSGRCPSLALWNLRGRTGDVGSQVRGGLYVLDDRLPQIRTGQELPNTAHRALWMLCL